jgi:hypothetical protein
VADDTRSPEQGKKGHRGGREVGSRPATGRPGRRCSAGRLTGRRSVAAAACSFFGDFLLVGLINGFICLFYMGCLICCATSGPTIKNAVNWMQMCDLLEL